MKRLFTITCLLAFAVVFTGDALANYTVTGTFMYRDREQDQTGFTGDEPYLPIRGADVEVLDNTTGVILESGVTNSSGAININVTDSQVRDVVVRVLTDTEYNPFLNLQVETWESFGAGDIYALETQVYTSHDPGTDLDIGTVSAEPLGPGEPFNIFDCMVNEMQMVNAMTGVNPGEYDNFRARFTHDENIGQAFYDGVAIIHIGGDSPWDDGTILHEGGHFTNDHWSWDDNPGGVHYVGDVNQDPRLSYGEGMASYWDVATRSLLDIPNPPAHLEIQTTGAPGPGHLSFYVEYEQPNWGSYGPACEVAVTAAMYDMLDDETWEDFTPGVGEDFDLLSLPHYQLWYVQENYMTDPALRPTTVEDFWDVWMEAYGDTARYEEMKTLFASHAMEFWEDEFEDDDIKDNANTLTLDATTHHTLFPKDDPDWFVMQGIAGAEWRVAATNRQPATHPLITVYESDGLTPVADNSADVSQAVQFVTDASDLFYVKMNQHSFSGIYTEYGAYDTDLRIVQAPDDSAKIQVTPTGIVVVGMPANGTEEREFTINNTGGGPLHATISDRERYGEDPPPASWVSESPEQVEIPAGGSEIITVTIGGPGLVPDTTYDAIIEIDSNDMVNSNVEVIVRLTTGAVGIDDEEGSGAGALPKVFALNQNYPNPFNPSTSIVYDVPESVDGTVPVTLDVYNMRGQMVASLVSEEKAAGRYSVHWDGRNEHGQQVSSGIYFYKIVAGDFVRVKKMVLLK